MYRHSYLNHTEGGGGGLQRAISSNPSIYIFAIVGDTGDPMAAPCTNDVFSVNIPKPCAARVINKPTADNACVMKYIVHCSKNKK